jgi:alcohol dehydrogenase (cytochrome c)
MNYHSVARHAAAGLLAGCFACSAVGAGAVAEPALTGADWEGYNNTLDGQRYSLLDQINASNAASLTEVCRVQVAARGSLQAGPVVVGDKLFITTATDTLAIDPVTCRVKWRHVYQRSQPPGLTVNRGAAYASGRVFRGTDDGRLIALNATTGEELWTSVVGDPGVGEYLIAAPVVWNGLVITGISGGEFGIRGRILAYDVQSGREVWRFDTIPLGQEAGADSWGSSKWAPHGGGGTWSTFAVDPTSAEVFVPVGNPVPDFAPADRPGSDLFTNSVVVLDARTGKLRWWYQLQPNDDHDHDLGAAPMLFRNSHFENMVAAAGKDGLLHIVDRDSHQLRFKVPVTTVDAVRKKATLAGVTVCPGAAGGVEWNGPAFDPRRMTIFVGAVDLCMILKTAPGGSFVPRGLNFGGSVVPSGAAPTGWLTAVNADTGAVRWKYQSPTPIIGGVTPTAGGIVMTGDNAGNFLVFDSASGKPLLKVATGGSIAGGVVTYSRVGRQYIAFTSGNVSPTAFGAVGRPSIVIMALPESASQPVLATTADARHGQQIYTQTCGVCHGQEGDRVAGKDLKSVKSRMTAEQLATLIKNPAPRMPQIFPEPRTPEDERDLRDVVAYVEAWK